MTAVEIIVLIGTIVEKIAAMAVALLATGGSKTPEEVRQEIKALVDERTDAWLAAEVAKKDAEFYSNIGGG
jgi:hypothetical protein